VASRKSSSGWLGSDLSADFERERTVRAFTELTTVPLVPELRLHLLSPSHSLWNATPERAAEFGLVMPYWAFAWPGGQALARYCLDHPELVRGRRIVDLGCGGAIEGLAARRAEAEDVLCIDVDAVATTAAQLNAAANRLTLRTSNQDVLDGVLAPFECDVVLAGDLTFEPELTSRLLGLLHAHVRLGHRVFLGDAGRVPLPDHFAVRASYQAPFDGDPRHVTLWNVRVLELME
jgi:predicted nicotinamide N-methyase